ncbi:MAG: aminoglycoside phosphotransferase family protein [Actinomycetota bacterium]|nr:aminoglycoside phosphotransferase family protein [Actinomycetota bacterium]
MSTLEQHEVAAYLLERRLVTRRSIVAGRLRVSDASSRNRNFRVSGEPGESYLLKQGIVADSARSLLNEAALYRRLTAATGRRGAALAGCVPVLHGYDEARGILILEWIADGEDLDALHRRRGRCSPVLAAALGRALATIHAVARDDEELRDDAPWVLSLHRPPLEALRYLSSASIELVRLLQGDARLTAALDGLRDGWRAAALVHRDVKWANWIAHPPAGGMRPTRVRLVDWEMAGWGDPGFDVGSALSDFAGFGLDATPGAAVQASAAFWEAYVRARGLDERAAEQLLERSARYAGARLVQSTYEHTQETAVMSERVGRVVRFARDLLVSEGPVARDVLGIGA